MVSEIEKSVKIYVGKVNSLAELAAEKLKLEGLLSGILKEVDVANINGMVGEWCDRRSQVIELLNFEETLNGLKDELEGLPIPGPSQIPGNLCTFPPN
jgi:hypothetical protein